MSKRIDITGKIFNDILVLEYAKSDNPIHAQYKCLCMRCNRVFYNTYCNLVYGKRKSCRSCSNKKVNYPTEREIVERAKNGERVSHIAKDLNVNRDSINRILKEEQKWIKKIKLTKDT